MITCYFGLPGCGKSSFLAKIAKKELKKIRHDNKLRSKKGQAVSKRRLKSKYKRVFSNYYLEGCLQFDFNDLGLYDFSDSLILLDELTLSADSRDFKKFNQALKEFFILHRHYNIDIIYATQQYDGVDKKIRDLTFDLFYLRKFMWWTYATRIFRTLDINETTSEIVNGYRFANIIERILSRLFPYLFKIRQWCFRPFVYKMFDSWDRKELPKKEFKKWHTTLNGIPID